MNGEVEEVAPEATPEDVVETPNEAVTQPEDQGQPPEGQPPEADAAEAADDEGQKSESQKRRERRKAEIERLRQSEQDALAKLDRIHAAARGEVEPQRDKFDDPDEYIAAKAAWNGGQAVVRREQMVAQQEVQVAAQQQQVALREAWDDQAAEAKRKHTDWEKVAMAPDVPLSGAVPALLMRSERGAEIAYHLGSNRDEAARISALPPYAAAMEIGRLEAVLSTPQPKTQTSAPPPPKPVSGRGSASRDPAKMSNDEYRKWRAGTR